MTTTTKPQGKRAKSRPELELTYAGRRGVAQERPIPPYPIIQPKLLLTRMVHSYIIQP